MVIFTEFLYISVPGIILSVKHQTIPYLTQLTSVNSCASPHCYTYRISVHFGSRYNSEYQTNNYCIYGTVNVSKYMCITPWLYIQNFCMFSCRYNSEHQTRNYCAYMTPLTSLNTCVSHHGFIYRISVYVSVPGIIQSFKPKIIAYITQLTSLNTCVLHHERIFLFSHL